MLRAGTLREQISITAPPSQLDEMGEATGPWTLLAIVRASVRLVQNTEQNGPQGSTTQPTYEITIRYREDVSPRHRLIWRGQTLDILSIADPDGRREQLAITAVITTPGGPS